MNIAILGGSFDPPHKGHVTIVNRLMKLFSFDQVWLMPLFRHPFSKPSTDLVLGKTLSTPKMRLEMTKCLEKGQVKISDYEIKKKTISYTVDTLKALSKNHPQDKFSFIVGTDQLDNFTKWKMWKEIINNFKLIIVPRAGFKKAEKKLKNIVKQVAAPTNIILIDKKIFPPIYISSTLIRRRIKKNKPIFNMVPKKIEKYIIDHRLYL